MLDVLWTPTDRVLAERMLDMAKLGPEDVLIDLGSGDGRIVVAAAKRGVRAIGIELDAARVEKAKLAAIEACVQGLTEFRCGNLFEVNLDEATVITCFLDREPHKRLLRKFAGLKPGTRIISNTFHLWEHDAETTIDDPQFHTARMWRLP